MAWDAATEAYGASRMREIAASCGLGLPNRQGGARFQQLDFTDGGVEVSLPDARLLRKGFAFLLHTLGENADLVDADGDPVQAPMLPDRLYELWLTDNTTEAGEWLVRARDMFDIGTELTLGREPWELRIESTGAAPIDFRPMLDAQGYAGVLPVALVVDVLAERGTNSPVNATIDTGAFPAGSTLLLLNHSSIHGGGGMGGDGSLSGAAEAGQAGGTAIVIRIDTSLVNTGTINGGGGGGGGGQGNGTAGGGGGGGGSGYVAGQGGAGGGGGALNGTAGSTASPGAGGTGAASGGSGGGPGAAGSSGGGGAAGGAAGAAIVAVGAGVTLNILRTGTINGATP